ncbi:MAG: 4Fe-4S dicluster domain-containing protein [Verrucomicrobia bacterium]|nr:4Fe-4S dicluster domain-containing protein [Verrucomicrobiota bacterium]
MADPGQRPRFTPVAPDVAAGGALTRRNFLRASAAVAAGVAGVAAILPVLRELKDFTTAQQFLQKHYKELTPEEMERVLERIAREVERQYGVRPHVRDLKPLDGVEFVYALNLTRCVGCRRCVHACVAENNQSRTPELQYIRVLKMPNGTFDLERSDPNYAPASVPEEGFFYMPVQCHQCKNPPCVKVCPVKATWKEDDGIVVIDYDWCIGCRYCEAACPYWARRFNFATPSIPKERINPDMAYLGNRPRPRGVMEKCHFCIQRTRVGRYPACLEVCPTGSRKFGNALDPRSEVGYILRNKRVFVLKEEVGTLPRFFYYFDI